jgi:Mg-chelatase subunit ChlD
MSSVKDPFTDSVSSNPADDLGRYRLLASAIAGRQVAILLATENEPTFTDGRTIFLGRELDHPSALAALTVQAALLAAGSLEPTILRRLLGRPGLARRYLTVEGGRALAATGRLLPRIRSRPWSELAPQLTSSPDESLARALSRGPIPEPPEIFGVIRPRRLLATITHDEEEATPTSQNQFGPKVQDDLTEEFGEDEETEEVSFLKLFSSPVGRGPIARMIQKMFGLGREPGSASPGGEMASHGARPATRPGRGLLASPVPAPIETGDDQTYRRGRLYPEWDVERRCYRPDWCTVLEVDPRGEELRRLEPPAADGLRRRLARLGVGLERRRRQTQGDDIDIDAAVESRVDVLAGSSPDEGVYIESQRRRRSLSVLILLDISGSSSERALGGRSVHEHQRAAAAALLDALHSLGDRVALYGFHSHGRGAVFLVRVKTFENPLDGRVWERLGGITPSAYTRLGAAIRHGAHILETQAGTERRLLLVLSDGFAYDSGYEGSYGQADARRALSEARRAGIGCLCLTLGGGTHPEALTRVFGTAAHANAEDLDELLPVMGRLFRRAMASAELKRRIHQRERGSAERLLLERRAN